MKLSKILSEIKLRYFFIFSLAFMIAYFFIITSFFQGWKNAKFFDAVPDLLILIVAFVLFGYAFKLKNISARKYIVLGAGCICLQRLMEIPLQEYQAIVGVLPVSYWISSILLESFGVFSLFFGFKEVIK